jgi:hypothetical protein
MTETFDHTRMRDWLIILFLTILLHSFFFWVHPTWNASVLPPRVDLQKIDPTKLDAIRKQWKQRERALLLNKDKSLPKDQTAPDNARYMSDRNIRVEKEQRAKQTNVIPKAGSPNPTRASQAEAKKRAEATDRVKTPMLSSLGVPLNLKPPKPVRERQSPHDLMQSSRAGEDGGDQAILERDLPQGSENLLNAQESIYYSFYSRLYEAIGPVWQSRIRAIPHSQRINPGDYSTVVDVIFDQNGNLIGIEHSHDSGVPEFDRAVDLSWKRIGRFPNPPRGLLDQNGHVHTGWTFTVQVGAGFNVDYLPPERNY